MNCLSDKALKGGCTAAQRKTGSQGSRAATQTAYRSLMSEGAEAGLPALARNTPFLHTNCRACAWQAGSGLHLIRPMCADGSLALIISLYTGMRQSVFENSSRRLFESSSRRSVRSGLPAFIPVCLRIPDGPPLSGRGELHQWRASLVKSGFKHVPGILGGMVFQGNLRLTKRGIDSRY